MISNVVKKIALLINNKLKKTAGENINSNNSLPRIALIVLTGELPCFSYHGKALRRQPGKIPVTFELIVARSVRGADFKPHKQDRLAQQ
jgi:hypothetical protein